MEHMVRFKTLADQEQARIVIKDAHAEGKLGWGHEFAYGARDAVCPMGHLRAASVQFKDFGFLTYDDIYAEGGQEAGFTYAMKQIDDAEVGV